MKREPLDANALLEHATADTFWVPDAVHVVETEKFKFVHCEKPVRIFNRILYSHGDLSDHAHVLDRFLATQPDDGPAQWMLTSSCDSPELRALLEQKGFVRGDTFHVQALRCEGYTRTPPEDVSVIEVRDIDQLRTLYRIMDASFGRTGSAREEDLPKEVIQCTEPGRRVIRYVAMRNGEPAGAGGMTMFPDLGFGLIWAGGVVPEHRGHGVYTALLAARVRDALAHGIHTVGLYAKVDTSSPIVAAQGFERHGSMTYYLRNAKL